MKSKKSNKSNVFYYLRANGSDVIDFNGLLGFEDMTDYINLSVFTGSFKNYDDLASVLKKLGMANEKEDIYTIDIVRRRGDKKGGYHYEYITDNLMYKSSLPFLSEDAVRSFMLENRDNMEVMHDIVKYYLDPVKKKYENKKERTDEIQNELAGITDAKVKEEVYARLEAVTNSLKKFGGELTNLMRIEVLLTKKVNKSIIYEEEKEYYLRLLDFINSEIYYVRKDNYGNRKRTLNKRGLIKLAKYIGKMNIRYEKLNAPTGLNKYLDQSQEYLSLIDVITEMDVQIKTIPQKEDDIDPDDYMFLEDEDFDLLSKMYPEKEKSSIEADKENLNSLKRRMGKG